jgi:endonuclease/exonuclease/phosphatase family metal-dependent hydrolase
MTELRRRTGWRGVALFILTISQAVQILRVYFPSVAWYLKDTVGIESLQLAFVVLLTISGGFLAAPLLRLAGVKRSLWLTVGVISTARFILQLESSSEIVFWTALVGSAAFAVFLPSFVAHLRSTYERKNAPLLTFGLLLGLTFDSMIRGTTRTLDLSWYSGVYPALFVLLLSIISVLLAFTEDSPPPERPGGIAWHQTIPLLAFGPFLTLQMIIYQNQGWISELSGLEDRWALTLLMLGNLISVVSAWLAFRSAKPGRSLTLFGVVPALVLTGFMTTARGAIFVLPFLLAQASFGYAWASFAHQLVQIADGKLWRLTASLTTGMISFIILSFLYYASLDIPLPFQREAVIPAAAILFASMLLLASSKRYPIFETKAPAKWAFRRSLVLLLFSIPISLYMGPPPEFTTPTSRTIRVMTYNIHSAYDIRGRQNPEAIAQVIEKSGADIVAMQEVSRGWLINGSTDLASWLSRRLEMPFLFHGTTGPMWGNAILSRYPILEFDSRPLPDLGTPLKRGVLWASVDVGSAQPLTLFATHFHHLGREPLVRLAQARELLDLWDGGERSILLGDLNARPGDFELAPFTSAGLIDSWEEIGLGPGLTFSSSDPFQRIDWIWHTSDLVALSAEVIQSTASDHLAVVVTIEVP